MSMYQQQQQQQQMQQQQQQQQFMDQQQHQQYLKERQIKQQYLVDNILSQGYDPQQFAQYMSDQKQNGVNVDSWTMSQIQFMVEEFKVLYRPVENKQPMPQQQQQMRPQQQQQQPQNSNQQISQLNRNQQQIYEKSQPQAEESISKKIHELDLNQFKEENEQDIMQFAQKDGEESKSKDQIKVISTQPLIPTKLNTLKSQNIEVRVTDGVMQQKKKLLQTTQYLTFKVVVPSLQWEVRRRDQDFNVLQAYLKKIYPHILVPPISQFKTKKAYDPIFLKKRSRNLEKFLRWVMRSEELKSDMLLVSFLSLQDNKIYNIQLMAASKAVEPKKLADITTIKGQVIVNVSEVQSLMSESNKLPRFVKQQEASYRRLASQLKRLGDDFKMLSTTIQNLQDEFVLLEEIHGTFQPEKKNGGLCRLFKGIGDSMQGWAQAFINQKDIIDDQFSQFFHFYALQGEQISQFYQRITTTLDEYLKCSVTLSQKKEKLYNARDIANMELSNSKLSSEQIENLFSDKEKAFAQMLPRDTSYTNELGQMFAYLMQQFRVEVSKAEDQSYEDMRQNLRLMAQAMQESYQMHLSIWSDFDEKIKFK